MRRGILLLASASMALQALLLLTLTHAPLNRAVLAAAIAALVAAAVLAREALLRESSSGIRAARRGGVEVLGAEGAGLATEVLLASPLLVVLRVHQEGRRRRVLTVWRDTLSAAEFRRFLATSRWARESAVQRSAV